MTQSSSIWRWSSVAVALVVGLVLVLQGTSAGYLLIIIAFSLLGASAAANRPHLAAARYGLLAAALLLIFLLGLVALLVTR